LFNALFSYLFHEQKSIATQETSTGDCVEEYVVNEEEFDDNVPSMHEHLSFTNRNYYYFCAHLLQNIIL